MNLILATFLLILVSGIAFALRGIWGHQIGGWVMGVSVGTGTGVALGLDMASTVMLAFTLAIAWAAASFVGWAGRGAGQQFLRGCLAYGALPGFVMALTLLPLSPVSWLLASLMIGLLTGISFVMSVPLMHRIETRLGSNATRAWRYGMEYPAGLLHGTGIAAFLAVSWAWPSLAGGLGSSEWTWYHVLLAAVAIDGVLPACGWKDIIHQRTSASKSLRPMIIVVVASNLVLSMVMIAINSVVGLFCTHLISTGVAGALYDKQVTSIERLDFAVLWVAILASVVQACLA